MALETSNPAPLAKAAGLGNVGQQAADDDRANTANPAAVQAAKSDLLVAFIDERMADLEAHVACARLHAYVGDLGGLTRDLQSGKIHMKAALEAEIQLRRLRGGAL